MTRRERRANIGRPWARFRRAGLRQVEQPGHEPTMVAVPVISGEGLMLREVRRELRADAKGARRAGKGIVGYPPAR